MPHQMKLKNKYLHFLLLCENKGGTHTVTWALKSQSWRQQLRKMWILQVMIITIAYWRHRIYSIRGKKLTIEKWILSYCAKRSWLKWNKYSKLCSCLPLVTYVKIKQPEMKNKTNKQNQQNHNACYAWCHTI